MYPYPNEMQTLEAASKLLAMIRGGAGTSADYFHSGFVLAGFALRQIVGEPEGALAAAAGAMSAEETLECVLAVCDPNPKAATVAALPPGFWRLVWELAKKIIDEWLNQPAQP